MAFILIFVRYCLCTIHVVLQLEVIVVNVFINYGSDSLVVMVVHTHTRTHAFTNAMISKTLVGVVLTVGITVGHGRRGC